MSEQTIVLNSGQQAIINQDVSKIFVLNNRYRNDNYINNSSYDPITIPAGTLMGRVHASGKLAPLNTAASDGSQFPVGVLAQDLIIDAGDTVLASICDQGDVEESKIIFYTPNQGLETVVSSRRMRDHVEAQGIKLVTSTEMTGYDNQ